MLSVILLGNLAIIQAVVTVGAGVAGVGYALSGR
jgi:hypothetical protein